MATTTCLENQSLGATADIVETAYPGTAPSEAMQAAHVHSPVTSTRDAIRDEVMIQGVSASHLADDLLQVDEKRAEEIRNELSANVTAGWVPATAVEAKLNRSLNWKLDLMILPILSLAYMFNQLDRTNLGNAQTAGFSTDLGISSDSVNTANSLFYASYVPLQPVMAAIGRRLGAPRFLGATLALWGVLTICHAFVKNNAQLIAVRILMGLAESGFYPTVLSYLSDFYPRYECSFRFALFYGFFSVAGAFGGLIAFGILKANGALHSWQYLFIIEGSIPVILGVLCPLWLAPEVRSAWYLTPEERAFAEKRMVVDSTASLGNAHKVTRQDFVEAFLDWRVWGIMVCNMLTSLSSQGFTVFFPVVIKGLGYTEGTTANLMTVPPYVAGAVGVWLFAWSSDRFRERTFHALGAVTIVILGLILTIVIPLDNIGGRYAGLMVLMFGAFVHAPVLLAWLAGNVPNPGKRTVAIGIGGYANLAGIIGSEIFQARYGPSYLHPLRINVGIMSVAWAGIACVSIGIRIVNRQRAKKLRSMTAAEIEEENKNDVRRGDHKYTFTYGL